MNTNDQRIQNLIDKVNQKKAEISKLTKPNFKTNCQFAYTEETNDVNRIALHTVKDPTILVKILSFLQTRRKSFNEVAQSLGLDVKFTWRTYSFEDWENDIKLRIEINTLDTKQKELKQFEDTLNSLLSPEMKTELMLKKLEDALKD